MRSLFLVIILIFSLQSWTKADDIKDFELEGMSIGDSLLKYFSEKEIIKELKDQYKFKNDKYTVIEFYRASFYKTYDSIQIAFKKNDTKYKIVALEGMIFYFDDIEKCKDKVKEVEFELTETFSNTKKSARETRSHTVDKTGKSKITDVYFVFNDKSAAVVSCYDWSTNTNYTDNFRVSVRDAQYRTWLSNEAY